jgi:hypothetical protein
MGGRSIASRAANRRQRQKMNMSRYSSSNIMSRPENMMVENEIQITPPSREVNVCQLCGFKARYKFYRYPQCGEVNKQEM